MPLTRRRVRSYHNAVAVDPIPAAITSQGASATRVQYAGISVASFVQDSGVGGSTTVAGRTFITTAITERCRQAGPLARVTMSIFEAGTQHFKFIVFRPNGANYDVVGKSELFVSGAGGTQTFNFATPVTCQTGDLLGVWLEGGAANQQTAAVKNASTNTLFTTGEVADGATGVSFGNTVASFTLDMCGFGPPPVVAVTGDSIVAGHNGTTLYNPMMFETGVGDINSEPMHRMVLNSGLAIQYQNAAMGSQTYAWVLSTGAPAAVALSPSVIWVHCGVNDVAGARTWTQVQSDLDAIRALTTLPMVVDEILPWPAGNDTQAATIRTWNGNLATWVAAQARKTVRNAVHDPFAVIRSSTGQLDDMASAYANGSGVHLSQAGVDLLASMAITAIRAALS